MKPIVVIKPKSKVNVITADEADHLTNIIKGGLMRKVTPDHVERQFLEQGYIRHAIGGLMATEAGHHALMIWEKGGRK